MCIEPRIYSIMSCTEMESHEFYKDGWSLECRRGKRLRIQKRGCIRSNHRLEITRLANLRCNGRPDRFCEPAAFALPPFSGMAVPGDDHYKRDGSGRLLRLLSKTETSKAALRAYSSRTRPRLRAQSTENCG